MLWKSTATHNSLLLTEQCDNYCLMCSQPPKERDDAWLFERAKEDHQPAAARRPRELGLTGGEPTLHGDALIDLLEHCRDRRAGAAEVHVLSNGRRFADRTSPPLRRVGLRDIMVGIPVYAAGAGAARFIVQAEGAFDETIRGILNLAALGQCVEIRDRRPASYRAGSAPSWPSSSPGTCPSSTKSPSWALR